MKLTALRTARPPGDTAASLTASLATPGLIAALLLSSTAYAGDGHDHGDPAPATSGTTLPRFAATSDAFELVGVLSGRQITLYLDRAADNAPVPQAQIELEIAGAKLQVDKHGDAFEATLPAAPLPGVLPVTATVTVGQEVDLLAGELDLHEAAPATPTAPVHSWKETAGWAAGAVAAIGVLMLVARRISATRQRRAGIAA